MKRAETSTLQWTLSSTGLYLVSPPFLEKWSLQSQEVSKDKTAAVKRQPQGSSASAHALCRGPAFLGERNGIPPLPRVLHEHATVPP